MKLERYPAALSGFLERFQLKLGQERVDGAIVLTLDKQYRVYCRPAPFGDLVMESRLLDLPTAPAEREATLRECATVSWLRMQDHAEIPVISPDGGYLLLQQRFPADASVDEFERSLENFVHAIGDWRRFMKVL
jgi:hypothetical protein